MVKWKGCHVQSEWVEMQPQFDMPFVSHNRTWELADIWRKSASQNDSFLERHTPRPAGKPFYFFLIVPVCACMCAPAFVCVCAECKSVPVQRPPTPPPLQLTGRWMLAVTPAWICSCQMRWGHGESTKTLINLQHCPAFCWSLPVVSNIYLDTVDSGKSAHVHRKQVANPTDLHKAVTNTREFWKLSPSHCSPTFLHSSSLWWSSLGRQKLFVLWVGCGQDALLPEAFNIQRHRSRMKLGELLSV